MNKERHAELKVKWRRAGHPKFDRIIDDPVSDKVFVVYDVKHVEALDRETGKLVWKYTCPSKTSICFPTCTVTSSGLSFLLWGKRLSNTRQWIVLDHQSGKDILIEELDLYGPANPVENLRGFPMGQGKMLVEVGQAGCWLGKAGDFLSLRDSLAPITLVYRAGENRLLGSAVVEGNNTAIAITLDFQSIKNSEVTYFNPEELGVISIRPLSYSRKYYVFEPFPFDGNLLICNSKGELVLKIPDCKKQIHAVLNSQELEEDFIVASSEGNCLSIRRFDVANSRDKWRADLNVLSGSGIVPFYFTADGLLMLRRTEDADGSSHGIFRIDSIDLETGGTTEVKFKNRPDRIWSSEIDGLAWTEFGAEEGNLVFGSVFRS
ncbi:hypothetical protein ACFQY0_08975 [Haloferula chungangensis]|uniref:Pyrrolo-quinoline quinone n=1 Tax=Haloferula chungangensis TaxID=1048331 RepID=A0ABW2L807_9BACT